MLIISIVMESYIVPAKSCKALLADHNEASAEYDDVGSVA